MNSRPLARPTWLGGLMVVLVGLLGGCSSREPYGHSPSTSAVGPPREYDVVVAGGSLAALTAAVHAANRGARVALIEPTDWIGGQITSSGVPAIDEAWHQVTDGDTVRVDVAKLARLPRHQPPALHRMLRRTGNPGRGWVSRFCFEPRPFLEQHLEPWARHPRLHIFRETVPTKVITEGETVREVVAIRRTPRPHLADGGYDRLPSVDLPDWYSPEDSERFTKETLRFSGQVFIDASEWGELLALADAPYRQGLEDPAREAETTGADAVGLDRCGQSTVFPFVQRYATETESGPPGVHSTSDPAALDHAFSAVEGIGYGMYRDRSDAWSRIWTYRRIRGATAAPTPGDLCLQNWGYDLEADEGGNDYPGGYLFQSKASAAASRERWQGGVDLEVLAAAEQRAFAWHHWFRHRAPAGIGAKRIVLARDVLGTGHGLSKLPYIRDTRRSIGLDGFVLTIDDLSGPAPATLGRAFPDTVAIGAYPADIHPLTGCDYPPSIRAKFGNFRTLPFHIPFRALTNAGFGNLLVAGKTMAQTFLANSATRVHPIEWATGSAAGVIAAEMAKRGLSTREALAIVHELQPLIRRVTPIEWTP